VITTIGSSGTTASERYLTALCRHSFLSPWSFANVFKQPGQEFCDLLVVFGSDVIIFSDKSCKFKETGNIELDWSRWNRKAIDRSESQIYGAERWLTQHPDRLFLDAACTERLPIPLPPAADRQIHRIVVAIGSRDACVRFYGGGSGSLRVSTSRVPKSEQSPLPPKLECFAVGHRDPTRKYVHVFDEITLDIVLGELDTTPDFCAYLSQKEKLSKNFDYVTAAGEEELLAVYLRTLNKRTEKHDFFEETPQLEGISFDEGFWEGRLTNQQYLAKKKADRISYAWDELIERYAAAKFNGPDGLAAPPDERALRAMASLNRVERRMVAKQLADLLANTPPNRNHFRGGMHGSEHRTGYAFFIFPKPAEAASDTEYFQARHNLLDAYCCAMKLQNRQLTDVVGIAMAPPGSPLVDNEELLYRDLREWSEEDEKLALEDRERLGLLTRATRTDVRELEYPEVATARTDVASATGPQLTRQQRRRLAAREQKQLRRATKSRHQRP
jgi:hypothetical protein